MLSVSATAEIQPTLMAKRQLLEAYVDAKESNDSITREQAEILVDIFPTEEHAVMLVEKFIRADLLKRYPNLVLSEKQSSIIHIEVEEYIRSTRSIPNSARNAYANVFENFVSKRDWQVF